MEQLRPVFEGGATASGVVAGGSAFGGMENPEGQCVGEAGLRGGNGTAAPARHAGGVCSVERGWCLGPETFRKELLEEAGASAAEGASYYGEIVREAAEARAERLVVEGLKRRKWSQEDLERLRKGDPGKVKLALELRQQTTMPLAWIGARLRMGSAGYVKWLLLQAKKGKICQ